GGGGGGIAASGTEDAAGPDEATGTSDDFASGRHARGENQTGVHQVGGDKRVRGGTTVGRPDVHSGADDAQGADAATNPAARGDDSFAAEISTGEAQGDDLSLSPSQDTQGLSTDDD
ncbi:MAG TPA: hypothetical protein VK324_08810, partial [Tepidisphaeraceae bacterium]|nr:hypothetical protein [Tepidisphaeraceae bacterium]